MIWTDIRLILYSAFPAFIVSGLVCFVFLIPAVPGRQTLRLLSLLGLLFPLNHSPTTAAVRVAFLLMEVFILPLLCWTRRPVWLL